MTEQYRLAAPQCPLCGGLLEEKPTPGAVVDVCADCHAIWIDWFDGDLSSVAADVRVRATLPSGHTGRKTCPRCQEELNAERLRGHGPEILRCGGCMGVLVPSATLAEVVAFGPPEDTTTEPPAEGLFTRLVASLRRALS
jgi:Zn-finger nucleic acid-binding protein